MTNSDEVIQEWKRYLFRHRVKSGLLSLGAVVLAVSIFFSIFLFLSWAANSV